MSAVPGTIPTMATDTAPDSKPDTLTDDQVAMLDFERSFWKYAGAKEQAVRERFDMSATRYYQVLNALIDTRAALEHDPLLVKRLRRLRVTRQRQRSQRRLGFDSTDDAGA